MNESSKYYLNHLDAIQEILDEVAPGKYEADPDQRKDLNKAGFLQRKGRKHIVPSMEEAREMELRFDKMV